MLRCSLIIFSLVFSQLLHAQYFSVSGKITNNKLEPIAFVSIKIKDMPGGTVSREDGSYELKLEEGKYDLIFSSIGFKSQIISMVVDKNYVQNILMEIDELKNLSEVIVKGKAKDRSEEIIRNVIRNKENILAAAGAYTCNIYIKSTQIDSSLRKTKKPVPDSIKKKNPERKIQRRFFLIANITLNILLQKVNT